MFLPAQGPAMLIFSNRAAVPAAAAALEAALSPEKAEPLRRGRSRVAGPTLLPSRQNR